MSGVTMDTLAAFDDAVEQILADTSPDDLTEHLVKLRFLFEAELDKQAPREAMSEGVSTVLHGRRPAHLEGGRA